MIASSDERRHQPRIQPRPQPAPNPPPAVTSAVWPGLAVAADEIGVALDAAQLAQFSSYRHLLLEWSTRFNLTAITDPDTIERRLFLDALLLVPAIDRQRGRAAARLVDIGSGAGFPGLPLAIARPELAVTLIEATGKKVAFLNHLINELGLSHVRAIHARAEDVARQPEHRGSYDLATARAVSSLPALLELSMPLLRLNGHAVFPKGVDLDTELAAGRRAAALTGAHLISADLAPDAATRIVIAAKRQPTPDDYPRRPGIPAREPLGTGDDRSHSLPVPRFASRPHRPRMAPRGEAAGANHGNGAHRGGQR